jgi:alcohol dehydrogenase
MRAFVVSQYKGPVRQAEVPEPVVGNHDVLVQVRAAGLNLLDEKIRAGEFRRILPYKLPQILGNDVAGTVIGVGAQVRQFALGDAVYARPGQDRIGTFAERIAVAETDLAPKPATVTSSSTTAPRTSNSSSTGTTWCWTAWAGRTSRDRCAYCALAGR